MTPFASEKGLPWSEPREAFPWPVDSVERYGMQRVPRPAKLIVGGDEQVSPANGPVIATVLGNLVEKLPSFGMPVDPKPPAATVVMVSGSG